MIPELHDEVARLFDSVHRACDRHPELALALVMRLDELVEEVDKQLTGMGL